MNSLSAGFINLVPEIIREVLETEGKYLYEKIISSKKLVEWNWNFNNKGTNLKIIRAKQILGELI